MPPPFIPHELPIQDVNWTLHIPLIGRANAALAKFEGVLDAIPNPEIFIAPLRTKEAVLSSKIEGTQASLDDIFRFDASDGKDSLGQERDTDIVEVINYRRALLHAESALKQKPFHLNLLLTMHDILLNSVRGLDKSRGHFRTLQNWIGSHNCSMEDALFVPPSPNDVIEHMGKWEKYYHAEEKDPLVQLAIIHAQFEIIHPFLDGNGRLGRILIPLFLHEKQLLNRPVFYLSAYLEEHREEYTAQLRQIGPPGSWDRWIAFFLGAIETQANRNRVMAQNVTKLYSRLKLQVEQTRSSYAVPFLDFIFERIYFRQSQIAEHPRLPSAAMAGHLVNSFVKMGILHVANQGAGRRSTLLYSPMLMEACAGEDVSRYGASSVENAAKPSS